MKYGFSRKHLNFVGFGLLAFLFASFAGQYSAVGAANILDFFVSGEAKEVNEGVELTVYNNDLAFVKEIREMPLIEGRQTIAFDGVPTSIIPSSVGFKDLEVDGTFVMEQTFSNDILSRYKLLQNYIGRSVHLTVEVGDRVGEVEGELLSAAGDIILKTVDGIEVYSQGNIVSFMLKDTAGMLLKPALDWVVNSPTEGDRHIETSYLASGIGWSSDYVLVVDEENSEASLQAWATVSNSTDVSYDDISLHLVAGDVNRSSYSQPSFVRSKSFAMESMVMDDRGHFSEESLSDLHLYSLGYVSGLDAGSQKQISFLSSDSLDIEKKYVYPGYGERIARQYTFTPSKKEGFDKVMPAGLVRVYTEDSSGRSQFIGEQRISHTPLEKEVDLAVGYAFDLQAKYSLVDSRVENVLEEKRCTTEDRSVAFTNSGNDEVEVVAQASVHGREVSIGESSHDWKKVNEHLYEFMVEVGDDSTEELAYTVTWCY